MAAQRMILHLLHRLAVALGLARRRVAIDPRIWLLGALGQPEREFEDYDRLPFLMARLHYGHRVRLPRLDCIEVALVEAWERRVQAGVDCDELMRYPTMPRFRHVCGQDEICECRDRWEAEGDRRYDDWKDRQDEERWDEGGAA